MARLPFVLFAAWSLGGGFHLPYFQGEPESLTGRFLVATSELREPRFKETVIYLLRHNSDGAVGLVVNRPLREIPLRELVEQDAQSEQPDAMITVYYGGPVQPTAGFILHSDDLNLESSEPVVEGVAVTTDPVLLQKIAAGEAPAHYLFALGYAGWAPGQLEGELAAGAWFEAEADPTLLFFESPVTLWKRLIDKYVVRL